LAVANIYVPAKRRATLAPQKVQDIAESMLQVGQQTPLLVRKDGDRFVLVEGLHKRFSVTSGRRGGISWEVWYCSK
jgi:sulfiredoxin